MKMKLSVATSLVALILGVQSVTAWACTPTGIGSFRYTNKYVTSAHLLQWSATRFNVSEGNTIRKWTQHKLSEAPVGIDNVCYDQAYINWNTPTQGTFQSWYGPYHNNCQLLGLPRVVNAPSGYSACYPSATFVGGWWRSANTQNGGWTEIGVLT